MEYSICVFLFFPLTPPFRPARSDAGEGASRLAHCGLDGRGGFPSDFPVWQLAVCGRLVPPGDSSSSPGPARTWPRSAEPPPSRKHTYL